MKFRQYFERQVTQIASIDIEVEEDEEDSETGYMVRHLAKRDFDPRTAEWTSVNETVPDMLDAELVTE